MRGQTRYMATENNGAMTEIDTRDYFVPAAELLIDGQPIEPQPGDAIEETLRGRIQRFELIPNGGRSWRFSDPDETDYRISTRLIASFDPDALLYLSDGSYLEITNGGSPKPLEIVL
ncbi:MAG: hypothetical protein QM811_16865 [Pirellulales bacterium]